jgi:phytoene dehydrogenase-like protein
VLLAQQSLFDPTRAPAGRHTAWAYCHVPNGSTVDMTERIEAQVERFAPGFRERILARSALGPAAIERYNENYVGGDINGGAATLKQLFTRPVARISPYTTPLPGVFLCSSSTPPGGGVHGMCGYHAARAALRQASGDSNTN